MGRACPYCYKEVKGSRGLRRHDRYCSKPKTRISHRSLNIDSHKDESYRPSSSSVPRPFTRPARNDGNRDPYRYHTEWASTTEEATDIISDNEPYDLSAVHDASRSLPSSRMTVSSSIATVVNLYLDVEGGPFPPGHGYSIPERHTLSRRDGAYGTTALLAQGRLPLIPLSELGCEFFYPFTDQKEYNICWWLFDDHTSAGKLKDFFTMPWWTITSSIQTISAWNETLSRIPYGIPDDRIIEKNIELQVPGTNRTLKYIVRYRSILNIIRFLISFPAFEPNLVYAPVRLFKDEERETPIWNEMHTGSWWWDQQKSLPPGSTLVPVLLASDKTQLTQLHGDKSSHPVYLTIGNLDKKTRRSHRRPSKILLGFLPTIEKGHHRLFKETSYTFKRIILNKAMEIMTQELQQFQTEGLDIHCADGRVRNCIPVIAGFSLDYEEQALLTGVKSGQHCVTCHIPPNDRGALLPLERYRLRDPQYTQALIRQARATTGHKRRRGADDEVDHHLGDDYGQEMMVDDVVSFMWSFQRVNMHEIMHIDILHQCLKGIVHRSLVDWVTRALQAKYGNDTAAALMDERFRAIPAFPGLKLFKGFSGITQWTGVEQKALVRQLVPALAPILPTEMIQYLRAVVDFTIHAQYYTHDSETLAWMEAAIKRMDILKEAFRPQTSSNTGFNIPKLHAITHYPMMIRKFGSADGYDTGMFESGHRYMVKSWYSLTNKREGFEEQILRHNQRAVNMMAMYDLFEYRKQQNLVHSQKEDPSQATTVSRARDLDKLRWAEARPLSNMQMKRWIMKVPRSRSYLERNVKYWRSASTIARYTDLADFLDALATYVRTERQRHAGVTLSGIAIDKKEADSSWVKDYPVCLHPSISCWKNDRDDGSNADVRVKELIRCDPSWQGQRIWRRDCVWVQEYQEIAEQRLPLQGRLPAQLLTVVSVIDVGHAAGQHSPPVYTGAFLDVYTLRDRGRQNSVHGMIEAQRQPMVDSKVCRSLGRRRFYRLDLILRSAHLVPVSRAQGHVFYINSYVDWDSYATLFDPDFLRKDDAVVMQISRAKRWFNKS